MPYIDKDFYDSEYGGTPINDVPTFDRLVKRASEIIDYLTNHALQFIELDSYSSFVQNQVKKATASQVEYLLTNGESKAIGGDSFGQVSAGNFSYGNRMGDSSLNRTEQMVGGAVIQHLSPTGLLYQGVAVYD